MKILLTNTGPWGTGSGTTADGVLKELRKKGILAKAFFPDSKFQSTDMEQYYGSPQVYHIVPFPAVHGNTYLYTFPLIITDPNPRNYQQAWTFRDMTHRELNAYLNYMGEELRFLVNRFKPDLVECQHIWALDFLCQRMGVPYICVAHHSDQKGFKRDERMRNIALDSAQKASYIFAVSDYVREEVIDLYRLPPGKVITIENGYDQEVFKPGLEDRQSMMEKIGKIIPEDMPVITFCGKISKTKGVDILLEANKVVQEKRKVLILIFGSGSLEEVMKGRDPDKYSLENVVVMGHRPQKELASFHRLAKMSLLPSRWEGFGIAALEAMGCGLPLVATEVGGLKKIAVGRIVPPEDSRRLAEAILEILELPQSEYQELCQQAFSAARVFSWKSKVNQRITYYRAAIKESKIQ